MARRAPRTEERRTTTLTVRLTASERTLVEQRAAAANLTPSGYLGELIRNRRVTVEQRETLDAGAMAELSRIGRDINQLATGIHAGTPTSASKAITAMQELMTFLLRDEITRRRVAAFKAEGPGHGSEDPRPRDEFQRRIDLSPAR